MKKKITIAAIALMAVLCSCKPNVKTAKSSHGSKYIYIDTLEIHNNPHEVLFWTGGGGMMHSPECWCKDKTFEI